MYHEKVLKSFALFNLLIVLFMNKSFRFHLQSSETGMIASCYDIGACLAVLFVTYIGGKGHKPSWIGWGMIICGFGSMVFALPHFVAPHYVAGEEINNICNSSISRQKCLSSYLESYRFVIISSYKMVL